jgi:hypothetical protein
MARTVATYCIYPSMTALHSAAEALRAEGFRQTDISVLYSDRGGICAYSGNGARDLVAAGPVSSAANVLTYLAGIGAVTLPDIGPLLAAGPLAGTFTGLVASGASPTLTGTLVRLGLPEQEAQCYEGCLKDGGILLSVFCDDAEWVGRAKNILTRTGAAHLSAAAERQAAYA